MIIFGGNINQLTHSLLMIMSEKTVFSEFKSFN